MSNLENLFTELTESVKTITRNKDLEYIANNYKKIDPLELAAVFNLSKYDSPATYHRIALELSRYTDKNPDVFMPYLQGAVSALKRKNHDIVKVFNLYAKYKTFTFKGMVSRALMDYCGIENKRYKIGDIIIAWRATNNPQEIKLARSGIELISVNHITGEKEKGLSVATGLHYAHFHKYAYQVQGRIVDFGSDGEPVLDKIKVLSKRNKRADKLCAMDLASGGTAKRIAKYKELAKKTKLTFDEIVKLGSEAYRFAK